MKRSTYPLAFWIGLFLFSIYLFSFSGKLHVMDEFVGFAVGNNWVQHGRPDVNQFIWTNHWHSTPPGIWGKDGNLYTKKAPGISLAAAPLIWLGHTIPGLNAVHLGLLTSIIITALTGSLLFIWLIDLNFSRPIATFIALSYGLCTIALVYARLLWEHSLMAFVFLLAMWAVHRAGAQTRWPWVLLCGAALSVSLTMRFEAAFAVALFGAYLFIFASGLPSPPHPLSQFGRGGVGPATGVRAKFSSSLSSYQRLSDSLKNLWEIFADKTRWLWLGIYSIIPILTGLWLLYFNFARFGSISETGYNREILFERPWVGMYGLLLSPSTGLFIYMPIMLLLFWGIRPAWRRLPKPYFGLLVILCLFYWAFYGSWFSWGSTWVWGPRFLLHTLPLMMLFVAEALTRINQFSKTARRLSWIGVGLLAAASFFINFLGIVVDLNEHFLRLGRNDNFVFNWDAFPPLGHWQILREGLVDIIWLRPMSTGFVIEWPVLLPALTLFVLVAIGLFFAHSNYTLRITHYATNPLSLLLITVLTAILLYQMMLATSRIALTPEQAQADTAVLETVSAAANANDTLFISMQPFGDVQEIATYTMAYLDRPMPTYAWIESEPRAIQPDERQKIWQAAVAQSERVWLFERWRSQNEPASVTAAQFNQEAFPVQEQWFDKSGKLTLYALPLDESPVVAGALNVPFQGNLVLADFAVFGAEIRAGEVLKIRLSWRTQELKQLAAAGLPDEPIISFVHLVDSAAGQNVSQQDRLLLDLQHGEQSPLLPGQTISQGYGLLLPDNLSPGVYALITGLYLGPSGQRLQRADDSPDDFLYLTDIVVK